MNNIITNLNKIKSLGQSSDEKLKEYQKEKLKEILLYSFEHVPYYREVLAKANVVNSSFEVNLDNFDKIPLLTKKIIRERFEDLKSDEIKKLKWRYNYSGGSTGEPIKLIQDQNYYEWNIANKLYYKSLGGAQIGCKELRFWGSNRDTDLTFMLNLRNKIYNRKDINVYNMTTKDMEKYVKLWNKFKPDWIEGYTQTLYEFAQFVDKNNHKLHKPKGILSTAGTLYEEDQKYMAKVFKCKVYNRYGSRETGDMAFGEEELNLSIWNHYIEILNDKKAAKSQTGNVYVTTLNNYAMPLIKYDIGDIATKSKNWNKLENVKGREISMFRTKEGEIIDGSYFTVGLARKPWLKKFQVVQKSYKKIEYYLTPTEKDFRLPKDELDVIEQNVKKVMGKDCEVKFIISENINCLKSGKFLYTRSEIRK